MTDRAVAGVSLPRIFASWDDRFRETVVDLLVEAWDEVPEDQRDRLMREQPALYFSLCTLARRAEIAESRTT